MTCTVYMLCHYYRYNVLRFGNGELLGAVNGMRPNGTIDCSCLQSREVPPQCYLLHY